ncbi:MAG: hypothetical protein ACYDGW_10340 [Vulcanimicrobiaceae bacterium]
MREKPMLRRLWFVAFIVSAFVVAVAGRSQAGFSVQQQRAQRAVYILVNVTPAPIVYRQGGSRSAGAPIIARFALRARGSAQRFDAPLETSLMLAQASAQQPVKVEAEVSPNPTATLLYTTPTAIAMSLTAGTTVQQTCVFTVTVDTTVTSWTLYHGLATDFSDSISTFPGGDLANNSHIQGTAPNPTATPYVVYADDGGKWAVLSKGSGMETFCVDLTLSIPTSVPGGAYSSNAIYTLYY